MLNLVRETLEGIRERSKHKTFVEAAMAACALVALTDEEQRLSELIIRDRVLVRIDELRSIDHTQAVSVYDSFAKQICADPAAGRARAMACIGALADDQEAAGLVIRMCVAVGCADQNFSARERGVVEAICRQLNVHPGDFGVYDI
jgi:tellurite resistance protein TerB